MALRNLKECMKFVFNTEKHLTKEYASATELFFEEFVDAVYDVLAIPWMEYRSHFGLESNERGLTGWTGKSSVFKTLLSSAFCQYLLNSKPGLPVETDDYKRSRQEREEKGQGRGCN